MRKKNRRSNYQSRVISRQIEEINNLKNMITDLEIDREHKKDLIQSVEKIREDFIHELNEIRIKKDKYEKLIAEVMEMRNAINQIVYKGKWSLIRFLIK